MIIRFKEGAPVPPKQLTDALQALVLEKHLSFQEVYVPARDFGSDEKEAVVEVANVIGTLYEGTACMAGEDVSDESYAWLQAQLG